MRAAAAAVAIVVLVAGCAGSPSLTGRPTTRTVATATAPVTERPEATLPSDALSQMEIAFIGTPRQAEIAELLEQAFEIYDLEWTEDNLSRAGSSLVALRQDAEDDGLHRITEMAILEEMVADGGLPGMSFPEAAGWIAAAMRVES